MRWPYRDKRIEWNAEKNRYLIKTRSVSFEQIQYAIEEGFGLLAVVPHPNQIKYPNQSIIVIELQGIVYVVPFVVDEKKIFLKTIYPSRVARKRFILE